jgi:hypothetical protein
VPEHSPPQNYNSFYPTPPIAPLSQKQQKTRKKRQKTLFLRVFRNCQPLNTIPHPMKILPQFAPKNY